MGTVFVYEAFTSIESAYLRTGQSVTEHVEDEPFFTRCSTSTFNQAFPGRNVLDQSNRISLNGTENPPGPYDDDDDDDDDRSN